ncbi:MAG TPA: hypothetical protein VH257_01345, partial [Chloroflexota bacterium]|nr:hypothetical protein [Chloroflexota bacterium]
VALAPLPGLLEGAPAWQQGVRGRTAPPPPRLAQLRSLARDLPPEAWIISALDGPLLEHHILRGTGRRYVPLSRGLEFVDKPPFSTLRGAPEVRSELLARAGQRPGSVAIDRWSLEFAEGLPDFRRELRLTLEGAGLAPGGAGAPRSPAYYVVLPGAERRGADGFALREGEALRDSGGRVFVYAGGERRHVPDVARLRALGLRWEDVRRIPDLVLEALPEGAPLAPGGA